MKDNERFNNILNECLERMLKGDSVDQCLRSYPEDADKLEPLLRTACEARQTCSIKPRPEFKERARLQMRHMLAEKWREPVKSRASWLSAWRSAWAVALTAVVVVAILAGGTVAAAGNSMPDHPLYPVKLATEQARMLVTPSSLSKAELYAELADKRVTEIVYLADKDETANMEATTERLNDYLTKMADLTQSKKTVAMMASPARDASSESQATSGAFAEPKAAQAPAAVPAPAPATAPAPPATAPAIVASPSQTPKPSPTRQVPAATPSPTPTSTQAPAPVASPTPTPTPTPSPSPSPTPSAKPAPTTRTAAPAEAARSTATRSKETTAKAGEREKLKEVFTRNAINNSAKLSAALKKAPASVKPALRKAIEQSLAGYEHAIKNIEEHEDDDDEDDDD